MRSFFKLLLFVIVVNSTLLSQTEIEKKGILKIDVSALASTNFYLLTYEHKLKDKATIEIGAGYGSDDTFDYYGGNLGMNIYFNKNIQPSGFHVGPRALIIYAVDKSPNSRPLNDSLSTLFIELDGILGYQIILGNALSINPYLGPGIAMGGGGTTFGIVFGGKIGVLF